MSDDEVAGQIDLWDIFGVRREEVEEFYSEPENIALLVGSPAWVREEQRKADDKDRRYSAVRSLVNAYRTLPKEILRVNISTDTILGKQLSADFVNIVELTTALYVGLTERQRDAWLMEVDRLPRAEIATRLEASEHAVAQLISSAGRILVERIFDPDLIVEIVIG